MFVVDANALVYAADEDSPYQPHCMAKLDRRRHQSSAWHLRWGILYEFVRITTHPRVMRTPWEVWQGRDFVRKLLDSPGLGILVETDRHAAVAREVFDDLPRISGNLVHDAHTAVLMYEHGIRRIYTSDTDFHRFPFVEPIDPLV